MRYESKHYYFARLMRVVNNYKHACKTLAERHQMSLAYLLASNSMFVQHDVSVLLEQRVQRLRDEYRSGERCVEDYWRAISHSVHHF